MSIPYKFGSGGKGPDQKPPKSKFLDELFENEEVYNKSYDIVRNTFAKNNPQLLNQDSSLNENISKDGHNVFEDAFVNTLGKNKKDLLKNITKDSSFEDIDDLKNLIWENLGEDVSKKFEDELRFHLKQNGRIGEYDFLKNFNEKKQRREAREKHPEKAKELDRLDYEEKIRKEQQEEEFYQSLSKEEKMKTKRGQQESASKIKGIADGAARATFKITDSLDKGIEKLQSTLRDTFWKGYW